jgi:hypothetical protein
LIEPPAGAVDWFFKLGTQVPDDPSPQGAHEAITHTSAVALYVTPRSFMLRSA